MTAFVSALAEVDGPRCCLCNATRDILLASSVDVLSTAGMRERTADDFEPGRARVVVPARLIHTLRTPFPIDVVFVDAQGWVVRAHRVLVPWRVVWHPRAAAVVELPAGTLERTGTVTGDRLVVEPIVPGT